MTPIKTIIFDLGGVLIDYDLQRSIDAFRALGFEQIEQYINAYRQSGVFLQLEEGTATPGQLYEMISRSVGHPVDGRAIDAAWCSFLIDIPDYKLDMLLDLRRQGYRVFMLSNTNTIMFEWMKNNVFTKQGLTVSDYFDRLFLSYEMHLVKPEEAIYRRMVADSGIVPSETLFIDDGEANIATSAKLGFNTYLARQHEDFRSVFTQYPLLSTH